MGANQSTYNAHLVDISDSNIPSESPVMVNSHVVDENGGNLMATFRSMPEAATTSALIRGASVKFPDRPCLGEREVLPEGKFGRYHWTDYKTVYGIICDFAQGLAKLDLKPNDKVGIYGSNCFFWQVTAFAAQMNTMAIVPVYDSLGPNAAQYIITHSECRAIVCHKAKLESLLSIVNELPMLKCIIAIDSVKPECSNSSIETYTIDDILKLGKEGEKVELQEPKPSDVALIMYTSGSTGTPKGCVMTHSNLIAGGSGFQCLNCSVTTTDIYLSFLPLAHIYEMAVEIVMIAQGASIGFYSGDVRRLTEDLQALRPTIVCGVPRVWNKISDAMKKKISELPFPKKNLVDFAIALKAKQIKENKPHSLLLDNLIFSQFAAVLGGKIRLLVSGGAPILPEVYQFLSVAITANIIQGYGLTETGAGLAVQEVPAWSPSDVGCCSPVSAVKLRAVDGFVYDPRGTPRTGELLVKGPHVFKEYYKDEQQTKATFVDDEWFATGDIVMVTDRGVMQIVDRAKQLVKLSQGEYLAITTLNDNYSRTKGVANIYVYADSHHNYPAAVVIPDHELLSKWKAEGIEDPTNSKKARDEVLERLAAETKNQGMRGFERIAAVVIDTEDFSIENGLLTPSQKPQWQALRKKYECALLNALDGKQ